MMNSRAQHAGARARLVALLRLEVVEQLREVAVGAHLARDVEGQVLLVRHRGRRAGAAPVLQLEELVDVVAVRALPELGGWSTGISISAAPIASSSSRITCSTLRWRASRRQPGPHAGTEPRARGRPARSGGGRRPRRPRAPP